MGDSWDDEEFDVKLPVAATSWEDEEEDDTVVATHGAKPVVSEEKRKKLEKERAAAKLARIEMMLDENESPEDRKMRERRQIEEGDHELTDDLFSGLAGESDKVVADPNSVVVNPKDLKDHLQLVVMLNDRTEKSKQNHVVAFTKEWLRTNEDRWEVGDLSEMILILTNQKEAKEKKLAKPTAAKKDAKAKKQTKKELLDKKKIHDDVFGDNQASTEYSNYEDQFDDFF